MICRTTCRVCDGSLEPVLSLGDLYVSNFISEGEPDGVEAPLELVLCHACLLLQLKHTVPAEAMYQNFRCLGQRWLKILWALWQTGTTYDGDLHARNQHKHGSWVLKLEPKTV